MIHISKQWIRKRVFYGVYFWRSSCEKNASSNILFDILVLDVVIPIGSITWWISPIIKNVLDNALLVILLLWTFIYIEVFWDSYWCWWFCKYQTGNTNTLAGNVPPKANLGDLRGLAGGLNGLNTSAMIDGGSFDGTKAYKDSKVCNMFTMQEFHRRYHEETGITFASLYPGCIATTGLFREHMCKCLKEFIIFFWYVHKLFLVYFNKLLWKQLTTLW